MGIICQQFIKRISRNFVFWSFLFLISVLLISTYCMMLRKINTPSIVYIIPEHEKSNSLDIDDLFEKNRHNWEISSDKEEISEPIELVIERVSKKYDMEPALIKAIIKAESDFNPHAISKKGAVGLMQVMPSTAKELGFKDIYDPKSNIEAGVKYLRYLLDHFNGDLILTLAAYNAGLNRVKRHRGVPPIAQTKRYIKKVLKYYREYKASV